MRSHIFRYTPAAYTAALLLGAAMLPLTARANLLGNGDFESQPNFGAGIAGNAGFSALTGAQIPGWTIESAHAATVHNTLLYPTISGNYSINMDGEGYQGGNADLYQDFATLGGTTYSLDYDWSTWVGDTTPRLNVTVTDTVTAALLYQGNFGVAGGGVINHVTASFAGTGNPLRLRINESPQSGYNDNAFMVDNFAVVAVPEAPTSALLAAGLLFVCSAWRRRR